MPNCIIMGCPHKTGNNQKFPGIVLHSFPSSMERIKKWILQTGQVFQDPDTLANKIYEGKKTDTFRMCSAHFTKDSYIFTAQKRFLKHNALPAIFPQATEGKPLIDEQKIVGKRKKKCERLEAKNMSSFICSRCRMSQNIHERKVFIDSATQTENDNPLPKCEPAPVLPMTQAVLMLSVPFQSYCTPHITPLIKQPPHSSVTYNAPHFPNSLPATSSQSFSDPLVEKEELQLPVSSHHKKDYKCLEESSPKSPENLESCTLQKIVRGRKLFVFEDCLDSLVYMVKCRGSSGCSKMVKRFNKEYRGSAVIIRGQCEDGHFFKIWESQPKVKRFFAGNVLLAASLFCSGLKYQEACDFFSTLGLRHISGKKYHHFRKYYCYPAVHAAWEKEHKNMTQELQDRPVCLSGARQYGTSGPNAKHCIYLLSDTITEKIVDFEIIQRTNCQSLMDMEKHSLEICMTRTAARGLDVACFVSDRYQSIVETMKENYDQVDHQFNVKHYAKSILKKLKDASRLRFCASIRPWIRNVYEHFLWSVQTSEQNQDLLREKWLSVLHHIVNKHSWEEGRLYKQCDHEDLSHKTQRETLWLKPGSPSFQKLQEIVTDPQLIEDLKHLTWNFNSRASSIFHSSDIRCRTGGPHSAINELGARVKLAALKHNDNISRRNTKVRVLCRNSTSDNSARKKSTSDDTARRKNTSDDSPRRKSMAAREKRKLLVQKKNYDYLWPVMEAVLGICEGGHYHTECFSG